MNRRNFIKTAAAAGLAASCSRARRDRRPNVVFILTDDQRWDCLGVAGHPFLKTPHLDQKCCASFIAILFPTAGGPTSMIKRFG